MPNRTSGSVGAGFWEATHRGSGRMVGLLGN